MSWYIKQVDDGKGYGLFAKQDITCGDVILEEEPLVCSQFSWNKLYKYRACDYCLKSLETAEEMCRRLAQNPSINLPHPECCKAKPETNVHCLNCEEVYCSMACREKAYNEYHKTLCPSSDQCDKSALEVLDETWRGFHFPPETASIQMIMRILARIKQEDKKEEFIAAIERFCHISTNNVEQIAHKLLGEQFSNQISVLRDQLKSALFDESVQHWFTTDGFKNIFALLGTNQQGIGSSALSVWVLNCDELNLQESDRLDLDSCIDDLYQELNNVAGTFLNCEGAGLYVTQSKCNHSCDPNAEVSYLYNNHRLTLKATKDLNQDEEITISYLSECLQSRGKITRQEFLRENYLFNCQCNKCMTLSEIDDVTSDEDYDEKDDDDNNNNLLEN
uniref:SET domain-containing protein n=1 Tax=Ciona savignyi TaxID=51511 RepID=H2ZB99_CIOSA